MKVENVKIYDLYDSMRAAGYPMRTDLEWEESFEKTLKRGVSLSRAADQVGAHDQWLTGVRVNFDLTFSNKAWVEAERYRFLEFVSSQSTMHRITKFDIRKQYNEYVDPRVIEIMAEKVETYNKGVEKLEEFKKDKAPADIIVRYKEALKEEYLGILYTNPAGFELTARLTTNYRCLKNIWRQRRNHRLPEWREFCKWIETLPYAKELICYEREDSSHDEQS